MIEVASGEYLDQWETVKGIEGRGFVRLTLSQGVSEFIIRKRRLTSTGWSISFRRVSAAAGSPSCTYSRSGRQVAFGLSKIAHHP
jgi:hypothetical protein